MKVHHQLSSIIEILESDKHFFNFTQFGILEIWICHRTTVRPQMNADKRSQIGNNNENDIQKLLVRKYQRTKSYDL